MRYKPSAGFALDGVNLTVKHGETVGIVGRTGSGKSSLLMGLFRMFELAVCIFPLLASSSATISDSHWWLQFQS